MMDDKKRLIYANALIETFEKWKAEIHDGEDYNPDVYDAIDSCVAQVEDAPTVDAVEVVHGRWIERKEIFYESEGEVNAIGCSVCGKSQRKHRGTNYCPNCGAKMEGDGNG